jgi:hypothetical protein
MTRAAGNFQLTNTIGIMGTLTKKLYETDFVESGGETAELLRKKRLDDVDWEHLVEEVVRLAGADKRAVQSHSIRMLIHGESVINARSKIKLFVEGSPSLWRT